MSYFTETLEYIEKRQKHKAKSYLKAGFPISKAINPRNINEFEDALSKAARTIRKISNELYPKVKISICYDEPDACMATEYNHDGTAKVGFFCVVHDKNGADKAMKIANKFNNTDEYYHIGKYVCRAQCSKVVKDGEALKKGDGIIDIIINV